MSHARYRPPDHSKGDESTIDGYMAVHDRPAAFEGTDGFSYSVEIMADPPETDAEPWHAFFLFVKWARLGAQTPEGHVESDYLADGSSESASGVLGRYAPVVIGLLVSEVLVVFGGVNMYEE